MPGQHPGKCGENEARALPNLRQIHADWVAFRQVTLEMAANVFGSENVMHGSGYPHAIGDPIGGAWRGWMRWRTASASGSGGSTRGGCSGYDGTRRCGRHRLRQRM